MLFLMQKFKIKCKRCAWYNRMYNVCIYNKYNYNNVVIMVAVDLRSCR